MKQHKYFTYLVFGLLICITQFGYSQPDTCKLISRKGNKYLKSQNIKTYEEIETIYNMIQCKKGSNDSSYKSDCYLFKEILKVDIHIKTKKEKASLVFYNAMTYFELEEYSQAEIWFKKTIFIKYTNPIIHYKYGLCLMKNGKFEEALIPFEKINKNGNEEVEKLKQICKEKMK